MTDLSLLTTDQLLTELESRFDDLVVVGRAIRDAETPEYYYQFFHKGDPESAIFMTLQFQRKIFHAIDGTRRTPDPWETL